MLVGAAGGARGSACAAGSGPPKRWQGLRPTATATEACAIIIGFSPVVKQNYQTTCDHGAHEVGASADESTNRWGGTPTLQAVEYVTLHVSTMAGATCRMWVTTQPGRRGPTGAGSCRGSRHAGRAHRRVLPQGGLHCGRLPAPHRSFQLHAKSGAYRSGRQRGGQIGGPGTHPGVACTVRRRPVRFRRAACPLRRTRVTPGQAPILANAGNLHATNDPRIIGIALTFSIGASQPPRNRTETAGRYRRDRQLSIHHPLEPTGRKVSLC